ncbi:unnamed protein product [Bemisia tabaci]|uniref:THD domain-containing protein n=1 Tax=Bemisia tabaci TaxID=7038 RepID=A0A9P0ADM6_BEMTA|nr:unnamed protein product [Bemisia tabaci]
MPDNETLYYNVIDAARRPGPFPVRAIPVPVAPLKKRKTTFREFLLTIVILLTCIASLGICAQLYWDAYLPVQRLTHDVRKLSEELRRAQQRSEEKIAALRSEIQRLSNNNKEEEIDAESEEVDHSLPIVEEDSNYNDPVDYEIEEVENTTQNDQRIQFPEQLLPNFPPKTHRIVEVEELSNERRRRSAQSTMSKTEKRSLTGNKMDSACENKDCDDSEMVTKMKLAKKQELDDGKLTSDDSKGDEMMLHNSNEQENSTHENSEQSMSPPVKFTKSKKEKAGKRKPKAEIEDEELQEEPPKVDESVLAAHFGGQTSKYIHGRHGHYLGNGHLYHPGGVFRDWEPSPWVRSLSMDKHFHLKDNGTLMVTKPGLYFVYAQIYYSNAHSLSSYRMYRNNEPVLQCTVEMHNKPEKTRNTCFAAGLVYLNARDQLSLSEVEGERVTIFEKTKSFFGLFSINQN